MPTLVKTDGSSTEVVPRFKRFTLSELYPILANGCQTIQLLWLQHHVMATDEDGKPKGLPPNLMATAIAGIPLVGNIVIFTRAEYNRLLRNHKDPKIPE